MRNFPKNYFHPTKYPVLTKVSIKLRVRKVRRYSIWEGKDKIKYLRACVVFCVWYVVCEEEWKKIRAWGEKQTNLQSVFLSSFFVSVLSEKTQSKNESIRVRQNKYIFSVYRPFSTIFENLAKRDKFWPDQGSNPGPQDYEPYHIPTTPTDQVTTYQFLLEYSHWYTVSMSSKHTLI